MAQMQLDAKKLFPSPFTITALTALGNGTYTTPSGARALHARLVAGGSGDGHPTCPGQTNTGGNGAPQSGLVRVPRRWSWRKC